MSHSATPTEPAARSTPEPTLVTAQQLPVHCPPAGAPLWAQHPRVYLDVLKEGEAVCPYCSARYQFSGERPHGHH